MTTIDHLDQKRGNVKDYNYDFGKEWNWKSIFGKEKICWLVPYDLGEAAGPNGDGTVFMRNKLNTILDENEDEEEFNYYEDQDKEDDWGANNKFDDPLNQ